MKLRHCLLVGAGLLALAGSTRATSVTVDLGVSTQNFTEYGLGANYFGQESYGWGAASWNMGQGACTESGGNTICTLSGTFTSATAGFPSGTYSLVTEYAGADTPNAGPNAPQAVSEPCCGNEFVYWNFDPSTSMTLNLFTSDGTFVESIVSGGNFVSGAGIGYAYADFACSGTAVAFCDPYDVGITAGAIGAGTVTGDASFNATLPTPEPSSIALVGAGLASLLGAFRRKQFKS